MAWKSTPFERVAADTENIDKQQSLDCHSLRDVVSTVEREGKKARDSVLSYICSAIIFSNFLVSKELFLHFRWFGLT